MDAQESRPRDRLYEVEEDDGQVVWRGTEGWKDLPVEPPYVVLPGTSRDASPDDAEL